MSARQHAACPARRIGVAGTVFGVAFLAGSGLAFADSAGITYSLGDSRGTVSSAAVRPGASVTFTATGFEPTESVMIALSSGGATVPYGSARSDATGALSTPVVVTAGGDLTLSATGQLSGHMATSVVSVSGGGRGGLVAASGEKLPAGPYSPAGVSALSIAALALAGATRLLVMRAKTMTAPRVAYGFVAAAAPVSAGHRSSRRQPPARKGGKHRKH